MVLLTNNGCNHWLDGTGNKGSRLFYIEWFVLLLKNRTWIVKKSVFFPENVPNSVFKVLLSFLLSSRSGKAWIIGFALMTHVSVKHLLFYPRNNDSLRAAVFLSSGVHGTGERNAVCSRSSVY